MNLFQLAVLTFASQTDSTKWSHDDDARIDALASRINASFPGAPEKAVVPGRLMEEKLSTHSKKQTRRRRTGATKDVLRRHASGKEEASKSFMEAMQQARPVGSMRKTFSKHSGGVNKAHKTGRRRHVKHTRHTLRRPERVAQAEDTSQKKPIFFLPVCSVVVVVCLVLFASVAMGRRWKRTTVRHRHIETYQILEWPSTHG